MRNDAKEERPVNFTAFLLGIGVRIIGAYMGIDLVECKPVNVYEG